MPLEDFKFVSVWLAYDKKYTVVFVEYLVLKLYAKFSAENART